MRRRKYDREDEVTRLVPHFPVLHFAPLRFGRTILCFKASTPTYLPVIFRNPTAVKLYARKTMFDS